MKILVVTPLEEERTALAQSLQSLGCSGISTFIGRLPATFISEFDLFLASCGHGKAQAALQTQYLIDHCSDVQLVICAGAAGALAEGFACGDLVVATGTVEHDYNLRFVSRPSPYFAVCPRALETLQQVQLHKADFRVHFGLIASGDEDVIEVGRARQLQLTTGAVAVAWEGAGVARACAFNQLSFLEIRGITDAANQIAAADFEANLPVAMHNVAVFLSAWLIN